MLTCYSEGLGVMALCFLGGKVSNLTFGGFRAIRLGSSGFRVDTWGLSTGFRDAEGGGSRLEFGASGLESRV